MDGDKIEGQSVADVLEALKRNATLIRMKLIGREYEQLTVIHAIRSRNDVNYFLIENPSEFQDILIDYKELPFQFEFNGSDNQEYSFHTLGDWIEDAEIWSRFPTVIERRQHRRNFRIMAPEDTKIYFTHKGIQERIDVINLSQGGTLGALVQIENMSGSGNIFTQGDIINNARLVFKENHLVEQVVIRNAVIVRIETDQINNQLRFGMQFNEMAREDENKMLEIIFELQRQYLRKRLPDT